MSGERGFTIIEILVAVLILTVGLLGLASTAALVTRMVGQGGRYTEAATLASRQFETFRSQWTGNACKGAADGSSTVGAFSLAWRVLDYNAGRGKRVQLAVSYQTPGGTRTNTFYSTIPC